MTPAEVLDSLHRELVGRKEKLQAVLSGIPDAPDLLRLLAEVEDALQRLDHGTLGECVVCGGRLSEHELAETPLARYCLCELTPERQAALQKDLDLAWKIQAGLLPQQNLAFAGWETHYRYVPAGPVSGDFVDLVARSNPDDNLHFLLGDAAGKGVSAALLMAHLTASFRSLIDLGLRATQVMARVNEVFRRSTMPTHYATLVYGRADTKGEIELCNAGHHAPLLLRGDEATPVEASSFPVGIFEDTPYRVHHVPLDPGDTLFTFTDGVIEQKNSLDEEYGIERMARVLEANQHRTPAVMAAAVLEDVAGFRGSEFQHDDITLMAIRRSR